MLVRLLTRLHFLALYTSSPWQHCPHCVAFLLSPLSSSSWSRDREREHCAPTLQTCSDHPSLRHKNHISHTNVSLQTTAPLPWTYTSTISTIKHPVNPDQLSCFFCTHLTLKRVNRDHWQSQICCMHRSRLWGGMLHGDVTQLGFERQDINESIYHLLSLVGSVSKAFPKQYLEFLLYFLN